MCGFAGIVDPERRFDLGTALLATDPILARRGPDGDGLLVDRDRGLAFRHHRLAIFDPRAEAGQPMTSASGRFTIVFNGAIHDHPERRVELEANGAVFSTTSDTEVLLAGFDRWGIEETLDRVDGMFALAVLDREANEIILARDRAGQKPLLLATAAGCVAFASDLRAIEALPSPFTERIHGIDRDALHWFLTLGVVPWPMSIRPGVEQVPPGGLVRIALETGRLRRGRWWSPPLGESGHDPDAPMGPKEVAAGRPLIEVLRESVHRRCRADRPVGLFLSAGIDSRLVAALAAEATPALTCFTLAGDGAFDESVEAAAIAERLGLRHHVVRADDRTILDTVLRIPDIVDEPFADSSVVATSMLAHAAREEIVVALGGDGGDELFGGYRRHVVAHAGGRIGARVAGLVDRLPPAMTGRVRIGRASLAEAAHRRRLADARVLDHAGLRATQGDAADLLDPLPGDPNALSLAERSRTTPRSPWDGDLLPIRTARDLMAADFRTYLPDDPLVKVDRATMAVGLEHRAPLLGREVLAAAFSAPTETLFDARGGRAPIRASLRSLGLPDGGAKRGFAVPIFDWLRGPLRDHAASLLLEPAEDPLSPGRLARLFDEVQSGRRDRATACWTAMSWRAWLRSRANRTRPSHRPAGRA